MTNMIYDDLKKMSYGELLELRSTVNHLIYLEEHPEHKKKIRKERFSKYWNLEQDDYETFDIDEHFHSPEYNKEFIEKLNRTANDIYDATNDFGYAVEVISSMLHGSRLG